MKTAILFLSLILCVVLNLSADEINSVEVQDMPAANTAASGISQNNYENPLKKSDNKKNLIELENPYSINHDADKNIIHLTNDTLKYLNKTVGQIMHENPDKLIVSESLRDPAEIQRLKSKYSAIQTEKKDEIESIKQKWIKLKQAQNKVKYDLAGTVKERYPLESILENESKSQINANKLIAGGSGSLDRKTVITFLFVEGNGSANYDWTPERKNYVLDQIILMRDSLENMAELYHGINIVIDIIQETVPINYEPVNETSGINYSTSLNVNGLDYWRSSVVSDLPWDEFDPNLQGLYDLNLWMKYQWAYPEGIICFVVNFDTSLTHSDGVIADWSADYIQDLLIGKPYCTVSFNTQDSLILMEKMMHQCLKLFGAADEYYSGDCNDYSDCTASHHGKLKYANGNCEVCEPDAETCIMRDLSPWICSHTAKHLGWVDSDLNGGGDVDDLPVDYTALVTGDFKFGDMFSVYTLSGTFINSFVVSRHNSYAQLDGSRTVQVLGMNYDRQKLSAGHYYGTVNDGDPFVFDLDLDNNHPAAEITNFTSYGPYLEFTVNGVAHFNMDIANFYEWDFLRMFAGDMLAGENTVYRIGWKWLKDGDYPNSNQGWACDGIDSPFKSEIHHVAYGKPTKWPFDSVSIDHETNEVTATDWAPQRWTQNAYLTQRITALDDSVEQVADIICDWGGWFYEVNWFHQTGSDSMEVYIEAVNPNGSTHSDTLSYITRPKTPRNTVFSDVYQTVCFPKPQNDFPLDPNDKFPPECEPYTKLINAIAYEGLQPDSQRILNMTGHELRFGCYVQVGENDWDYEWDSLFISYQWGVCRDTAFGLHTYRPYTINARTVDKFGGRSDWALVNYESVIVGGEPMTEPDPPGAPSGQMSKENTLPEKFSLSQNYPNPFNPNTSFILSLPVEAHVNFVIYNILGQKVAVLSDDFYPAGEHELIWDGVKLDGNPAGSGIYLARLSAGDFVDTKKIIMMK